MNITVTEITSIYSINTFACQHNSQPCIAKQVSKDIHLTNEVEVLGLLKNIPNFPRLVGVTKILGKKSIVTGRLGEALSSYHEDVDCMFSLETCVTIGIQMISLLEQLHEVGYVHGDIKPDNIIVGDY